VPGIDGVDVQVDDRADSQIGGGLDERSRPELTFPSFLVEKESRAWIVGRGTSRRAPEVGPARGKSFGLFYKASFTRDADSCGSADGCKKLDFSNCPQLSGGSTAR